MERGIWDVRREGNMGEWREGEREMRGEHIAPVMEVALSFAQDTRQVSIVEAALASLSDSVLGERRGVGEREWERGRERGRGMRSIGGRGKGERGERERVRE
jgi:hypothetical protein